MIFFQVFTFFHVLKYFARWKVTLLLNLAWLDIQSSSGWHCWSIACCMVSLPTVTQTSLASGRERRKRLSTVFPLVVGTGYFLVATSLFPTVCLTLTDVRSNKAKRASRAAAFRCFIQRQIKNWTLNSTHGCTLKQPSESRLFVLSLLGCCGEFLALAARWCTATGHMVWESKVTEVTSCSLLKRCRAVAGDKRDPRKYFCSTKDIKSLFSGSQSLTFSFTEELNSLEIACFGNVALSSTFWCAFILILTRFIAQICYLYCLCWIRL